MSQRPLIALGAVVAGIVVVAGGLSLGLAAYDSAGSQSASSRSDVQPGEVRLADDAVRYIPDGAALGPSADGVVPDETAQQLWSLFSAVAGDRVDSLDEFAVYNDPDDTSMASVMRADDPSRWNADVNTAWIDDEAELEHTMVHEVGHILTLSTDQVPETTGACPTVELGEGCPEPSSLVAGFQSRFWAAYGTAIPADDGADEDEVAAFFREHGSFDTFVSEYAATNMVEDVAESWAECVLSNAPGYTFSDATGSSEASQKVRYFDDYPAFAAERTRIREALSLD
ncbi:MAG: hypothetical protein EPO52_04970 [Herbiconiux sp.]|uniref:hypothetical protein n=1 Tax=Herbiconiux sp. TaxID=1871186 RepID=UPI0012207A18|nr:hypothetical protein [Herbiconiux sp.]TAJ49148.1 MAG: hypothetical protein EPO52_04970 [Herbiconiux sp.]